MTTTKLTLPGKITVAHLQALCSSTGLPQAGSKSVIQQNLRQAAQSVQHIPDNARILSIDLGLKNFAFSLLTPAPSPSKTTPLPVPSDIQTTSQALLPPINLHTWNHLDLTTPLPSQNDTSPSTSPPEPIQFTPTSLSSLTYSLISNYLLPLKPTHILIERQRFRTGNASNIFEWTIRVNTLEAMLHACFATLKGVNLFNGTVISISPKTVAGYLFPNPGKTSSEETETGKRKTLNPYQIMKANKVSMLGEWLQQGKLIKPKEQGAEMAHGFLSAWKAKGTRKKKGEEVLGPGVKLDDLSDSVLQGMVWLQWQRNLEGLKGVGFGEGVETGAEKAVKMVKRGTGRIKDVDVREQREGEVKVGAVIEKKKSGRRKKIEAQEEAEESVVLDTPKKTRGRRKKADALEEAIEDLEEAIEDLEEAEPEPVKKRAGRPKKAPAQDEADDVAVVEAEVKKKGRGRPKKVTAQEADEVNVAEAEMEKGDDVVLI